MIDFSLQPPSETNCSYIVSSHFKIGLPNIKDLQFCVSDPAGNDRNLHKKYILASPLLEAENVVYMATDLFW